VSFFLAQRPTSASFSLARRCHLFWRNAPGFVVGFILLDTQVAK